MLYQTENPHGGDIYKQEILLDYSANTNPYGTPQGVLDAISQALPLIHHYPDPCCRELVSAIAAHEGTAESTILCGNGAAELIYAFCMAVQPRIVCELAPTFAEYALATEKVGGKVVRYPLNSENFRLDAGILSFLEENKPDVLFLCNPNNPTGQLIDHALLLKTAQVCRRLNIRLFLDECFLDMTQHPQSMVSMLEEFPNMLILKAFTKSYGMAGVRLGYCMSGDSTLLQKMSQAVQPWNVSTLAQKAGVAALKETAFLEHTVQTVAQERQWLTEGLQNLGFRVIPGCANYLLFQAGSGLDAALLRHGVAIRNCANYHGLGDGWYRIAVRLRHQNESLIEAIRQVTGGK